MISQEQFDWLSDLMPLYAAQAAWDEGSYLDPTHMQLLYQPRGAFAIACGAGLLAEHIRRFRITPQLIQRLGQVTDAQGRCVFHESFLNHLQRLRLRVQVNIAPEGSLLLPGEPLLVVQGPLLQVRLLSSAFHFLLWESTHWASEAALRRWAGADFAEEDTPGSPSYPFNPQGWKIRAAYIGGASADEILDNVPRTAPAMQPGEGLVRVEHRTGSPLQQIRRLFKGNQALGDLWLSPEQEEKASVSKTSTRLLDQRSGQPLDISMTRFQNLYQPVLVKGHPVLASPRLGYLRQRTLKQLEVFKAHNLTQYPQGWLD
jgi:hypothetical protein